MVQAPAMYVRQPEEPVEEVSIHLGNEDELREFYETRFRSLQQIPCKSIAKDWIKMIEPRKQTLHPYNGGERAKGMDKNTFDVGELCKPEWWPAEGCRHREPDHISRQERLVLLMHLLRNLWDPDAKEGYRMIRVEQLRASTMETVSSWANQEAYRHNRMILEGIYNMRQAEERLRNNETDASEHISCPAIPRTLYASRKPKKTAGAKRRFEETILDRSDRSSSGDGHAGGSNGITGRHGVDGLHHQPRQHQPQIMQAQQQSAFRNSGQMPQNLVPHNGTVDAPFGSFPASPTNTDMWSRHPGVSSFTVLDIPRHTDISTSEATSSWQFHQADPARLPSQQQQQRHAAAPLHFGAEHSMSPSNGSDEMVLSPRGSTHPSSVSSDFPSTPSTQGHIGAGYLNDGAGGASKHHAQSGEMVDFGWHGNAQESAPQIAGVLQQQNQHHGLSHIMSHGTGGGNDSSATTSPLAAFPDQTAIFESVNQNAALAETGMFAPPEQTLAAADAATFSPQQQWMAWNSGAGTATPTAAAPVGMWDSSQQLPHPTQQTRHQNDFVIPGSQQPQQHGMGGWGI